ncbi:hypothetical protein UlMin_021193, partial [Ulmus minor]
DGCNRPAREQSLKKFLWMMKMTLSLMISKMRQNSTNLVQEKGFNFDDVRLMRGAWRNEPNPDLCQEFFRCLAICHIVLLKGEETPEKVAYQAPSPDAALVTDAKNVGFFFY